MAVGHFDVTCVTTEISCTADTACGVALGHLTAAHTLACLRCMHSTAVLYYTAVLSITLYNGHACVLLKPCEGLKPCRRVCCCRIMGRNGLRLCFISVLATAGAISRPPQLLPAVVHHPGFLISLTTLPEPFCWSCVEVIHLRHICCESAAAVLLHFWVCLWVSAHHPVQVAVVTLWLEV